MIPIIEDGWEYNDDYPCDTQFIEYLSGLGLEKMNKVTIFHMGPGIHHKVGLWAMEQKNIFVRSISITPIEVKEYISIATENPWLNSRYLVDFGDIHLIEEKLLPKFDFISLFHLGEISSQIYEVDYPSKNIESVIGMMSRRLSIGGELLFYNKSVAWKTIKPIVELSMYSMYSYKESGFADLSVYKKEVL